VTTQHIEPENSDVNETVVQQSSASETPATAALTETEVATPASEQVIHIPALETHTPEKQVDEESIRPFTDYIEEFRQTEVRFGPLLEEPQVEPFSSLVSGEEQGGNQFTPGWANTPFGESTLLEGVPFAGEDVETHAGEQHDVPVESNGNVAEKPSEPLASSGPGQVPMQEQASPAAGAEATSLTERPVSPLLRPASRNRLPRHGNSRHREEPAGQERTPQNLGAETARPTPSSVEETSQTIGDSEEPTKPAPVESAPAIEQPRPERRYRFDRRTPAASAPAQARTEESKASPAASPAFHRTGDGHVSEREEQAAQQSKQPTGVVQPIEQPATLPAVVQEQVVTNDAEAAKGKPAKVTHDGRRRHGQERQREKAQATPATSTPPIPEVAAPVAEVSETQTPEVALEDLPPLEYSELQAASSRRRRRRRPGSASPTATAPNVTGPVAAKPVTTDQTGAGIQTPSPVAPVAVPRSIAIPGSSVPSAGQYSILSGQTVSQMNQGNDVSGPFMGPEPSPARGSTVSRTVRPIRNEAQRIPTYPARPEVGASSASINHLANVVAQAIQTQSDRMVAELRRANQIPTNVSVSLPPFPSTERVGVFVDVANLLYSARTQRMTIDFGKLLDFLRGNRRLVRAHAYCPTSPQPGDDQMFLQAVKGLGYRITTKNYKTFSSGAKKADLDLDLCMDVVRLVDGNAVDCIVLVSGDSDFMPMLDYCSDHGVRVEVAAFDESMSATLRQSCDLFVNLSMLEEIRA
jgi:uncharacterized LabA/DUF88 family protein